jgi:hypothetical protein
MATRNNAAELKARLESMTATWTDRSAAQRVIDAGLRKLFYGHASINPSSKKPTESARRRR